MLGAGVAGLAAARDLHARGLDVTVIEARERIGGRIWTVHDHGFPIPIELGAEFVHDAGAEVSAIAESASIRLTEADGDAWTSADGRLRSGGGISSKLGAVFAQLDANRTPDRSFADALATMRTVAPAERRLALQYVEGFEAADPAVISERSLAEHSGQDAAADSGETHRMARIERGYDAIVDALATSLTNRIRLGHVATRVRWGGGEVAIELRTPAGETLPGLSARSAIIAVPLGVLTASPEARGRLALDPLPETTASAFAGLRMGAAIRVALELDEAFWLSPAFAGRHEGGDLGSMAFLFADAPVAFPTWWTASPARAPLLVGWRGGPKAWELAREPHDAVVDAAVESAATLFGFSIRAMARRVRAAHTHDWSNDPFARGAYAYARVGGSGAGADLARPLERTIYFAGEHVAAPGRSGTVDRAIASGRMAAAALLRDVERTA